MKRNQELEIQIMNTVQADDGLMSTLSYKDFDGITIAEFVEHCKLLADEGLVEARLAFRRSGSHQTDSSRPRLLRCLNQECAVPSRKLGF